MTNYKKLFAIQKKWENTLKEVCPELDNKSGIYFWKRQEKDKTFMYIGKAKNLMARSISHCMGYEQRLDISIRKRGFYSNDNRQGWQLKVIHCEESELDEQERKHIEYYKDKVSLYNVENGGVLGKVDINTRKERKGYSTGLKNGYNRAIDDVRKLMKYLDVSIKGKTNKTKERMLAKFNEIIGREND